MSLKVIISAKCPATIHCQHGDVKTTLTETFQTWRAVESDDYSKRILAKETLEEQLKEYIAVCHDFSKRYSNRGPSQPEVHADELRLWLNSKKGWTIEVYSW